MISSKSMPQHMEPRLVQTQNQKLILSPQMRHYLRLLQLPLAELGTTIEQELTENPTLEEVAKATREEGASNPSSEEGPDQSPSTDELRFDQTVRNLDKLDENFREEMYAQGDLSLPETRDSLRQRDYRESLITSKESLFDYLLWQTRFLNLTETERKIAEEIIGNLNDDGYFNLSLEEMAQASNASASDVEKVLREIQNLDPPGIAARNLEETMLLQLKRKGPEAELAIKIIQDYLPLLEKRQWEAIASRLGASPEAIRSAARLIAHLDPKPGRSFYGEDPIAVTPDASVYHDEEEGKWEIEIHDEELPELRVSPYYRRLLKNGKLDATSRRFLREKIQAAMDFMKALGQRRSTLSRITEEIVAVQTAFFEKGFSELRPLRLKDISSRIGIHESTVSRAIQGKYISTPQGTISYKDFFSSSLDRTEGGVESQKSIMEKIRELIRSEDPRRPLSDQTLTRVLQQQGIKIARRTVAKYRELLKILPSYLRAQK